MTKITPHNFQKASLEDWQAAFYELYGHIDNRRSIESIWRHAMVNASKFSTDIRKNNFGLAFEHLAHLMNWSLTFVSRCQNSRKLDKNELFSILKSISEIFWEKYPNICPYCNARPCTCSTPGRMEMEKEPAVFKRDKEIRNMQDVPRSLDEWSNMFDNIYGGIHSIATINELSFHLVEETGEVADQIVRIIEILNEQDLEMKKADLSHELADVFSWICSVVNKINHTYFEPAVRHFEEKQKIPKGSIPVETLSQILWDEYGSPQGLICPLCKNAPCFCDKKLRL